VPRSGKFIEQLVDRHYEAVYRFAYRLTGNVQDAAELTQEAFCVAQERLRQLRDPSRARAWLYKIARNLYLQNQRRLQQIPMGDGDLQLAAPPPQHISAEEVDEEQLQRALNQLPEEFRTPLVLYYFGEHSYREIADILGIPIGTVMSRIARAKEKLRVLLGLGVDSLSGPSAT